MQLLAKTLARIQQMCAEEVRALTERAEDVHSIENLLTDLNQAGVMVVNSQVRASTGLLVATALIRGRDYENAELLLLRAGLWRTQPAGGHIGFAGEFNGRPFQLGIGCLPKNEQVAA